MTSATCSGCGHQEPGEAHPVGGCQQPDQTGRPCGCPSFTSAEDLEGDRAAKESQSFPAEPPPSGRAAEMTVEAGRGWAVPERGSLR